MRDRAYGEELEAWRKVAASYDEAVARLKVVQEEIADGDNDQEGDDDAH